MTDQVTTPPDHKLDGIAGWLVIPFVGLMIGIFDHSGSLFDHELTKASVEIFVGNRVLAVGSLVVFTLMCRKHSIFPIMIIVYAVTDTAFHTLEYIATITDWLGIDPKIAASEQPRVLESLRTPLGFWFVFVPYFLVSERVKATFSEEVDYPI